MKIILFGGAFNPPHLGHLLVIQQAFELIDNFDELWLLPDYQSTFLKPLINSTHRLKMIDLLIKQLPLTIHNKVKLEALVVDQKLSGETYVALQHLKKQFSQHSFTFLMGTDQLPCFSKWGHWQELLKELHFYIYPRNGYDNHITYPNMTLLQAPTQVITNISSTLIRERVKKGLTLNQLMPENIVQYIKENHLYHDLSA